MGMGFAPTWLRQVRPPASQNHFNYCSAPPQLRLHNFFTQSGGLSGLERKGTPFPGPPYCNLAFPGLKERFFRGNARSQAGNIVIASDVNKDWTCKDKDQAYKDQDKDKD